MLVDDVTTLRVTSDSLVIRVLRLTEQLIALGKPTVQITVRFLKQEPIAPILYCELLQVSALQRHAPCYRLTRNLRAAQSHDFTKELFITISDMETWTEHWILTPD